MNELPVIEEIDFKKLSSAEIDELKNPYGANDAMCALKLGVALACQEEGIAPSEFESLLKTASIDFLSGGVDLLGKLSLGGLVAGTLGGGYSGYLRHKAEKSIEGKDDPEVASIEARVRAYREMIEDLKRTNAVTSVA